MTPPSTVDILMMFCVFMMFTGNLYFAAPMIPLLLAFILEIRDLERQSKANRAESDARLNAILAANPELAEDLARRKRLLTKKA